MKEIMKRLSTGQILTSEETLRLMDAILADRLRPEQIGFILACYEFRAPTGAELSGFVSSLLKCSISVGFNNASVIDVCGTGGDALGLFNVSTCVSFVVASAGLKVAKHGSRAISSRCGSFDVLEALDISVSNDEESAKAMMDDFGIAFLFAPSFHPVLGVLSPMRRNLGVRTIFNAFGPLLNPGRVKRQLIGVYSEKLLVPMAEALKILGSDEVMIVHGEDGSDEISLNSKTKVAHLRNGEILEYEIDPKSFGMDPSTMSDLVGGDAQENAAILIDVLKGKRGATRNITLLNAGAALLVGGAASSLEDGIRIASHAIDSGRALKLLQKQQDRRMLA